MERQQKKALSTQLFLGILLTSGVKVHLNESAAWRRDRLTATSPLSITAIDGKEYLGRAMRGDRVSLPEVRKAGEQVIEQIHDYCPKLGVSGQKLLLLTQQVIG